MKHNSKSLELPNSFRNGRKILNCHGCGMTTATEVVQFYFRHRGITAALPADDLADYLSLYNVPLKCKCYHGKNWYINNYFSEHWHYLTSQQTKYPWNRIPNQIDFQRQCWNFKKIKDEVVVVVVFNEKKRLHFLLNWHTTYL